MTCFQLHFCLIAMVIRNLKYKIKPVGYVSAHSIVRMHFSGDHLLVYPYTWSDYEEIVIYSFVN